MYAIIKTGGKQYRASEGDVIEVEKLPGETGDAVVFDQVLVLQDDENGLKTGQPFVEGCSVEGKVLRQGRARKIIVFKYKPKKNYRRKKGHRQPYTRVRIEKINYSG